MDDRMMVKLVISIQAKGGRSSVYGAYELGKILGVGCEQLGYNILEDTDKGEPSITIYAFIIPKQNRD